MEQINQIRNLSIWIFLIPVVVINLCLLISINYNLFENTIFVVDQIGRSNFSIPYMDGGLSISRASRTYPAYLLFKPFMLITGVILIVYWIKIKNLINKIDNENNQKRSFLIYGILSAIFLIFHSIFLGVNFDYNLFKLFRRIILLGFILFEIIAQSLLIIALYKIKEKITEITNRKILIVKMVLVLTLIIVALAAIPILIKENNVHFKHALEWNYFIGVISFYLLSFLFWKKSETKVHTPEGV